MNPFYTWSTWDVRCLNAVMKVPDLAEVRLIGLDSKTRMMIDEMRWESLVKLGPHSTDGSYFEITLKIWNNTFELAFAAQGDQFCLRYTPLSADPTLRFLVAGLFRWNAPGTVVHSAPNDIRLTEHTSHTLQAGSQPVSYLISCLGSNDFTTPVNTTLPGILMDGSQPFFVRCNHKMSAAEMDQFLADKKAAWLSQSVHGAGWLDEAPEAAFKGMIWNTIFEATRARFCTPVTREWCIIKPERPWFGSYVIFVWDTFLCALLTALQDEQLAYLQIESVLQGMVDEHLPLLASEVNTYAERSQPPVGAYCVLKLYRQFGNIALLKNTFKSLLTWHNWWMKQRDGNGDGLLEWGTNLEFYGEQHLPFYLNECRSESGLDNSAMYDGTRYNPQTHTMEIADVGLNSLYALDCWALAEMAGILRQATAENAERTLDADEIPGELGGEQIGELETGLRAEFEQIKARINELLWNDDIGAYCNLHWDGHLDETLSPTSFYPLLAGIASPEQARRMVDEHLLNPKEFWGDYVLPTASRNHPAFQDNNYWRGRIWAPTNFLVGEGLKRCGFDDAAYQLARKSLNLFNGEWQGESHIHENYNAISGDGDDVENADPVYTWGGLLALMGISELAEAQPWGKLRFGNLEGEAAELNHIHFGDGVYSVRMDPGLHIIRRGQTLLESDIPVLVTDFYIEGDLLSFHVRSRASGTVRVYPPAGTQRLTINDHPILVKPEINFVTVQVFGEKPNSLATGS